MPVVRTGPLAGLVLQLSLLAVLAMTVGLGTAGWLAGAAYGLFVCAALTRGLHLAAGRLSLGAANWVTLTRACLAGAVTGLVADSFAHQTPVGVLMVLCVVALLLDAVDGYVARRTKTVTGFGARFDMEIDAFLILVLSIYVARGMGAWVIVIGAMRYLYLAATWLVPWLPGPLPPRYWRKVVAAIQGITLTIAAAGVLPGPLSAAAVLAALALLTESFGRDIWWRWQERPSRITRRQQMEIQHEPV